VEVKSLEKRADLTMEDMESMEQEKFFWAHPLHALHGDNIFALTVKDCFSRSRSFAMTGEGEYSTHDPSLGEIK
jgi:hypothetical protein